jgi:hypothetical protein
MRSHSWRFNVVVLAILCFCGVTSAGSINETSSPRDVDYAVLPSGATISAQEPDTNSDTDGIQVPEPQGLLFVAMAICGLTAIHLRRRWG